MTTWKKLITAEMEKNGETYADILYANALPSYRQKMWEDASPEELEEVKKKFPSTFEKLIPPNASADNWDEIEFDDWHGGENGMPFIVYTEKWIYFSVTYDGREWVASIPRSPKPDWEPRHFGD